MSSGSATFRHQVPPPPGHYCGMKVPPDPIVPPSELPKPNFAVPTVSEKRKSSGESRWWEWPIIIVVVISIVALIVLVFMGFDSAE